MSFLSVMSGYFDTLTNARRMAHLFSLSDAELSARGLSREELKHHYLASLGNR